jgi:hypothetical protein
MVSHLLLTVLTNFSRPVRNVTLNVLSSGNGSLSAHFALGQLRGSLQKRKISIYENKNYYFFIFFKLSMLHLNFESEEEKIPKFWQKSFILKILILVKEITNCASKF